MNAALIKSEAETPAAIRSLSEELARMRGDINSLQRASATPKDSAVEEDEGSRFDWEV